MNNIGTLAEVVLNEKEYSTLQYQRGPMYQLTDAIDSHIASTTSADYTHLSNSTNSLHNDISSLQNLRNTSFSTKKSKFQNIAGQILCHIYLC